MIYAFLYFGECRFPEGAAQVLTLGQGRKTPGQGSPDLVPCSPVDSTPVKLMTGLQREEKLGEVQQALLFDIFW